MTTPAGIRGSASRLLKRYGSLMTFKLYGGARNLRKGSQSPQTVQAEVRARAALLSAIASEDAGVKEGEEVLLVEAAPFRDRMLSDRWKVTTPDGAERQIVGPVATCRVRPTERPIYFEAMIGTGSRGE